MRVSRAVGFFLCIVVASAGGGAYWWYAYGMPQEAAAPAAAAYATEAETESVYVRFDMEVFDVIMREYVVIVPELELATIYSAALAQTPGSPAGTLPATDRRGTAAMLADAFARVEEDKRKTLAVDIAKRVLATLAPQGRNGLFSERDELQFRDHVNNIDRSVDLYETLGVQATATPEVIAAAYEEKAATLAASDAPEAKEELAQVERAHTVLADSGSKVIYDETKMEPSLVSRMIGEHTLYVDLSKVTGATLQELVNTLLKSGERPKLKGMIIDVRGNIGGALDFTKYLLALFVGPNQLAFDLMHQGVPTVERTPLVAKIDALAGFKDIVILTDGMTQSTAELTAAVFKRMRLATVVGVRTRGWGTVENTFPLKTNFGDGEKYSALLVHSLTLRDDNEAIEGRGVDPNIDVSAAGWEKKVREQFRTPGFADAVIDLLME